MSSHHLKLSAIGSMKIRLRIARYQANLKVTALSGKTRDMKTNFTPLEFHQKNQELIKVLQKLKIDIHLHYLIEQEEKEMDISLNIKEMLDFNMRTTEAQVYRVKKKGLEMNIKEEALLDLKEQVKIIMVIQMIHIISHPIQMSINIINSKEMGDKTRCNPTTIEMNMQDMKVQVKSSIKITSIGKMRDIIHQMTCIKM